MTIRSTYALDVDTARALEQMAARWRVSKSEALRRAIHSAACESSRPARETIEALDKLQRSLRLSSSRARAWARRSRSERRSASAGREAKSR